MADKERCQGDVSNVNGDTQSGGPGVTGQLTEQQTASDADRARSVSVMDAGREEGRDVQVEAGHQSSDMGSGPVTPDHRGTHTPSLTLATRAHTSTPATPHVNPALINTQTPTTPHVNPAVINTQTPTTPHVNPALANTQTPTTPHVNPALTNTQTPTTPHVNPALTNTQTPTTPHVHPALTNTQTPTTPHVNPALTNTPSTHAAILSPTARPLPNKPDLVPGRYPVTQALPVPQQPSPPLTQTTHDNVDDIIELYDEPDRAITPSNRTKWNMANHGVTDKTDTHGTGRTNKEGKDGTERKDSDNAQKDKQKPEKNKDDEENTENGDKKTKEYEIPNTNFFLACMVAMCFNLPFGVLAMYLSLRAVQSFQAGHAKQGQARSRWSIVTSLLGIALTTVIISSIVLFFAMQGQQRISRQKAFSVKSGLNL